MKLNYFLLLNSLVAVLVISNSGCLSKQSKSNNKSSALRYGAGYIANRRIFNPTLGKVFDGKAKYVFHNNNTFDYFIRINEPDWIPVLNNVPVTITGSSASVDWSSCKPETYCGKLKNDTDPELLDIISSGSKLVKYTKKVK